MSHGIDVCACGTVVAQCRCMDHTERSVVCQSCKRCRAAGTEGCRHDGEILTIGPHGKCANCGARGPFTPPASIGGLGGGT